MASATPLKTAASYNFNACFDSADLSDVTVSVAGHEIKAHKIILAQGSDFFKSTFKEGNVATIELHGGSVEAAKGLIAYLYGLKYDGNGAFSGSSALFASLNGQEDSVAYAKYLADLFGMAGRYLVESLQEQIKWLFPHLLAVHARVERFEVYTEPLVRHVFIERAGSTTALRKSIVSHLILQVDRLHSLSLFEKLLLDAPELAKMLVQAMAVHRYVDGASSTTGKRPDDTSQDHLSDIKRPNTGLGFGSGSTAPSFEPGLFSGASFPSSQPNAPTRSNLFGSSNERQSGSATIPSSTSNLYNSTTTPTSQPMVHTPGGLFGRAIRPQPGNAPAPSSLFDPFGNVPPPLSQPPLGLFGGVNKPQPGDATARSSLFGNSINTHYTSSQPSPQASGGLFGGTNKPSVGSTTATGSTLGPAEPFSSQPTFQPSGQSAFRGPANASTAQN